MTAWSGTFSPTLERLVGESEGESEGESQGPDAALVRRILAGDAQAFATLVARFGGTVFSVGVRMLGNRAEAEDLSQDVFLKVHQKLRSFDVRLPLAPWIRRIASNETLNRLRGRRADRPRLAPEDVEAPDPGPAADAALEAKRRADRVACALATLPENQRLVVTLKYVESLTAEEIGAALGVPRNTVKTWLFRAKESLRRALADDV